MTEVAFYHLTKLPLERALPRLLERTLDSGKRAVVLAASEERVRSLDSLLWTYDPASWLPHGSGRDAHPADQPVWLTAADENPNGAEFLFLTEGMSSARLAEYDRCFDLFDGNDADAVQAARDRWATCRESGHELAYWAQGDGGRWERKA